MLVSGYTHMRNISYFIAKHSIRFLFPVIFHKMDYVPFGIQRSYGFNIIESLTICS